MSGHSYFFPSHSSRCRPASSQLVTASSKMLVEVSDTILAEVGGKGKRKSGLVTTFFGFTTEAQSPQSEPLAPFNLGVLSVSVGRLLRGRRKPSKHRLLLLYKAILTGRMLMEIQEESPQTRRVPVNPCHICT